MNTICALVPLTYEYFEGQSVIYFKSSICIVIICSVTGRAPLIRNDSIARFSFELNGNSN